MLRLSALRSDYPLYFMLVRWLPFGPCMAFHAARRFATDDYQLFVPGLDIRTCQHFAIVPASSFSSPQLPRTLLKDRFAPAGLLVVVVCECNRDLNRFALDVVPRPECSRRAVDTLRKRKLYQRTASSLSRGLRRGSNESGVMFARQCLRDNVRIE